MGTDFRIAIPPSPESADLPPTDLKRRRLLLAIGAGGAAVASTAASGAPPVAQAKPAPQPEHQAPAYRVTDHVRDYYRSTKI